MKVRKRLITDRESILASQQAKKQRELKKHAKIVQSDVLQQKALQKKKNLELIKKNATTTKTAKCGSR